MSSADPLTRHLFSGFMRLHILFHATKSSIYGAEIAEELAEHGYRVSQGTLYPTLHQMARLGYLVCATEWVQGRRRKTYAATPAGKRALREARKKLRELVAEVLEGHDEGFREIQKKHRHGKGKPS